MTTAVVYGTNSFISLTDAETYFATRLHSTAWSSASAADKDSALITATKRINKLPFIGEVEVTTQPLAFPRYVKRSTNPQMDSLYLIKDVLEVTTPTEIKEATCEEAIALLEYGNSAHLKNQDLNISSVGFGGTSTSYNTPNGDNKLLSATARTLVEKWTAKGFTIR